MGSVQNEPVTPSPTALTRWVCDPNTRLCYQGRHQLLPAPPTGGHTQASHIPTLSHSAATWVAKISSFLREKAFLFTKSIILLDYDILEGKYRKYFLLFHQKSYLMRCLFARMNQQLQVWVNDWLNQPSPYTLCFYCKTTDWSFLVATYYIRSCRFFPKLPSQMHYRSLQTPGEKQLHGTAEMLIASYSFFSTDLLKLSSPWGWACTIWDLFHFPGSNGAARGQTAEQ